MKKNASIRILLADDDKDDCLLFQNALEELSMPAVFKAVYDGEQLMRHLTEGNELPTVLFLDLNMPRKNGFTCLEEIKANENLKQIPVVILSTSFDVNIADNLYNKGAHYYICKPSDFTHLKTVIERALILVLQEPVSQPPKEKFLLSNFKTIML